MQLDERGLAYLHSARIGEGGLGMCAATTLYDLARERLKIEAYGPGVFTWPFSTAMPQVSWRPIHTPWSAWAGRYTHRRWLPGHHLFLTGVEFGRAAAAAVAANGADACFAFSGVALETLRWTRARRLPATLESATGHIRHFYDVSVREHDRWNRGPRIDHPTLSMVEREEEEYRLADCVRVSSGWARESFVQRGVPCDRIRAVPQIIDTGRFSPPTVERVHQGPLRVCYAGIVSLAKGFPYLFDALRKFGREHVALEIAGSTGTRSARALFDRLRQGLPIVMHPQDPVPVYHRAELLVFPSLHDGFGFVVAEAMACGLPVIVTSDTGAAEWVTPESGWIVPPANSEGIAAALAAAMTRRAELPEMGRRARAAVLNRIAQRSSSLPLLGAAS
jgi:glycosyltransferase involved in cell wall biosynthesis